MKRIKAKTLQRDTVAKNGSNIRNGKHRRAAAKREMKSRGL